MDKPINDNHNILWVDYAKFFGIFLMILGHIFIDDSYKYIGLFNMPLFFIIAGYLYKQKSQKENFSKIIWGLLIPYFIYQFLYLPLKLGYLVIWNNAPFFKTLLKCICGILIGNNYETFLYTNVCAPCWFIYTIIGLRLIFNYIGNCKYKILIITILSLIISKILIYNNIYLYFCLNSVFLAIPYFSFGLFIQKKFRIEYFSNIYWTIFIIILSLIILKLLLINYGRYPINVPININKDYIDITLFFMYLSGIIGTIMMCLFSNFLKKKFVFIDSIILAIVILYLCYLTIIVLEKRCPLILGKYVPKKEIGEMNG